MDQKFRFPSAEKLIGLFSAGATDTWLAAIIHSSNDAIVSKTLDGIITSWNPAAERMFGFSEDEMLETSIRRIVPDRLQSEEDHILASIARGQRIEQFETMRLHKDGHEIPISVNVSPILNEKGEVVGASKIARDITKEVQHRKLLADSEDRFRNLADNMSQFAWMADATGHIFWYNKRWFEYTGTTLEQMQGYGWAEVHHPEQIDRVMAKYRFCMDNGQDWEDTFPLRGKDGEYRWFLSRARPIRDEDGTIIRWFGTNTDITEERERREQIRFLMREVNHRSKNMLALVQGIARQTGRKEHPEFVRKFENRLHSLSASHDLLTSSGWRGMTLEDLLASQLGHLSDLLEDRIHITGDPVSVNASCAQTIGMALYELATNAAKYGALSNETGEVDIHWELIETEDPDKPRLRMSWQERGGPSVIEPDHKGFGSVVIGQMCKSALSGEVILEYRPDGFFWSVTGAPGRGLDLSEDEIVE